MNIKPGKYSAEVPHKYPEVGEAETWPGSLRGCGSPWESKSRGGKKQDTASKKTENIHIEDVFIHHSLSPWLALLGSHYHIIVSFTKLIKTSGNCKEMEGKKVKGH